MRIEFEGTEQEFRHLFGVATNPTPVEPTPVEPTPVEPTPVEESKIPKKRKADWVSEAIERIDATVADGGTEKVLAALAHFDIKKVQELKVSDFPEFMEMLNG